MYNTNYFYNIKTDVENRKILFRVGYKNGITKISSDEKKRIDLYIKKSKSLCSLKCAYTRLKIWKRKDKIFDKKIIMIKSKNLSNLLMASDEIVFMAATVGEDVIKERDKQVKAGNPIFGIIIDATASVIVDAGLDWMQDFLNAQLAKEGLKLTKRFSPGYGDLDLSVQKIIYKVLELKRLNIRMTKKYLLIPEKSVLAITGIIKNTKNKDEKY